MDSGRHYPEYYNDIGKAHAFAWSLLHDGVVNSKAEFHRCVCASFALDGTLQQRIVILRHVDELARTIRFHTDIRSPKVAEIRANPIVNLLFYDAERKIQLRMKAKARVEHDSPAAQAAWQNTREMSRMCYRAPFAPGVIIPEPEVANVPRSDGHGNDAGYEQFTIVNCAIEQMEWYYLAATGHRKAQFQYHDDEIEMNWLAP